MTRSNGKIIFLSGLLATACYFITMQAVADVYKQVDKDGNVTYTDVPTQQTQNPVKVPPITTIKSNPVRSSSSGNQSQPNDDKVNYRSLSILKPGHEETIRANGGNITITLQSQPGLEAGHKYVVFVDGTVAKSGQSSTLTVNNIARGQHSLSAEIRDADNNSLQTSNSITIQVLRASVFSPARPRP